MGKLTDEEKSLFDKLSAKANAPDDDDDDVIEWWEEKDGTRRGGSMSVKRAKSTGLFSDLFGDKEQPSGEKGGKEGTEGEGKTSKTSERYFGGKKE